MGKVLYAVMGNTHGHIMRALAIAAELAEHEFHFVGGGRVPENLAGRYPCLEVPVLRTAAHHKGRVSVARAAAQIAARLAEVPRMKREIGALIERWQPDVAFVDREFFTPFACRAAGLRAVSIDHSHLLVACRYEVPPAQRLSAGLAYWSDRALFDRVPESCIVSFYHPPLRPGRADTLLPPVLRPVVRPLQPCEGETILCYQTSATSRTLVDALRDQPRPVLAYGFGHAREEREGNITFRVFDEQRILEDLASCAYAVVNGGHNLLCEAFHLGKPVLCLPVPMLFEQWLNADHVRRLGYGDHARSAAEIPGLLPAFERRLPEFRARLAQATFDGTTAVAAHLAGRFSPA